MSGGGPNAIVCHRCEETVRTDIDNCPHCGAKIRGITQPVIALVVGLVFVAGSVVKIGQLWPFGLVGLIIAFGGGYFLYDYRRRLRTTSTPGSSG